MLFTSNENTLLEEAFKVCMTVGADDVGAVGGKVGIIRKAPIRKLFFLRQLKEELAAEGLSFSAVGSVDWQAIIDFLVKYGPVILQLLMAFL